MNFATGDKKVMAVTGGSSGIGKAVAGLFSARGWRVYELSRSGEDAGGVRHITADVTIPGQVEAAFGRIGREAGRLDLLVNNAGFGISGAAEAADIAGVKGQFDVNFFGELLCTQKALPLLRESGGGRIVNLSSVAAVFSIPFQAFYSASKAAVNSLTLALANELRPFNIQVCAVMPGDVSTGFTRSRRKSEAGGELYGQAISRAVSAMERDEQRGMDPSAVAAFIYKLSEKRRLRPLYTVGARYKLMVFLSRLLPAGFSNRIVGMLYIKRD